jgi:hypothetical protein
MLATSVISSALRVVIAVLLRHLRAIALVFTVLSWQESPFPCISHTCPLCEGIYRAVTARYMVRRYRVGMGVLSVLLFILSLGLGGVPVVQRNKNIKPVVGVTLSLRGAILGLIFGLVSGFVGGAAGGLHNALVGGVLGGIAGGLISISIQEKLLWT